MLPKTTRHSHAEAANPRSSPGRYSFIRPRALAAAASASNTFSLLRMSVTIQHLFLLSGLQDSAVSRHMPQKILWFISCRRSHLHRTILTTSPMLQSLRSSCACRPAPLVCVMLPKTCHSAAYSTHHKFLVLPYYPFILWDGLPPLHRNQNGLGHPV